MQNIHAEIILYSDNFKMHILVEDDLTRPINDFIWIEVYEKETDKKYPRVEWDFINYFLDITKEKKEQLKRELGSFYEKGMIKEIKALVKRAIKLKLIN